MFDNNFYCKITICLHIWHEHFCDRKDEKLNENNLFSFGKISLERAISGEIIIKMHGCVFSSFLGSPHGGL